MPSKGGSATFVASRPKTLAVAIALFAGTVAVGVSLTRLATAAFSTDRLSSLSIVLVPMATLTCFLAYLDYRAVMIFYRPSRLSVTEDDISEYRNGIVQCERLENLSCPQRTVTQLGGGSSIGFLEMARSDGDPFRIRDDIYAESGAQILAVVEDAIARRTIEQPAPPSQASGYVLVILSAVLSISALTFLWRK